MRAVVQRAEKASVIIDNKEYSSIGKGLFILLGIKEDDRLDDIKYIAEKSVNLRIFSDDKGIPNLSADDLNNEILVVSQFTLYGDAAKGRRPSYIKAAKPENAKKIYNDFLEYLSNIYKPEKIKTGMFQTEMKIDLINDGPFTILLDSERKF